MTAYLAQPWIDFFVAAAGASGALAGLVIVALSVNINQILKYSHLPVRAGAAIATLVLVLVSSMAALIPQRAADLGIEILAFGICAWLLQILSTRRDFAARLQVQRPPYASALGLVQGQIQVLPFIIGGISLIARCGRGLYWVAAGSLAIFIFSVLNAWVLLIEILR
jgi:hypothetical protein